MVSAVILLLLIYVIARALLFFARSNLTNKKEIASPPKYKDGGSQ
jgi:hypothetical protein